MQMNRGLVIPEGWGSLEEFTTWFLAMGCPRMIPDDMPPEFHVIPVDEVASSNMLFRHEEARFQVEHYMMHPNKVAKPHSHPIEQVIVFLGGSMKTDSSVGGGEFYPRHAGKPAAVCKKLPVHAWHSVETGPFGAIFLNCQWWPPEIGPMTSAVYEYDGKPLGPNHARILGRNWDPKGV